MPQAKIILLFSLVMASPQAMTKTFSVGLMGDLPYSESLDNWQRLLTHLQSPAEKPAFTVHVGDIKSGSSRCDGQLFQARLKDFNQINHPLFYTPGDNEWTDCHRTLAGKFDPLERLKAIRKLFATGDKSFGKQTMPLVRQKSLPENTRWSHMGVGFATIHVVGSNNNLGRNKANDKEYEQRSRHNLTWLKEAFTHAKKNQQAGLMLIIHANPDFEQQQPQPSGFADFRRVLAEEVISFGKPVSLVHGDTHHFQINKPIQQGGHAVMNFTRVEVFGAPNIHWVKAEVNASWPEVFRFYPRQVPGN